MLLTSLDNKSLHRAFAVPVERELTENVGLDQNAPDVTATGRKEVDNSSKVGSGFVSELGTLSSNTTIWKSRRKVLADSSNQRLPLFDTRLKPDDQSEEHECTNKAAQLKKHSTA